MTSQPTTDQPPIEQQPEKLIVMLSRDGGYARIRLASYAGPGRFADFRKAIEGAKYDFQKKVNLAPLDKVPAILNRLRDTGFEARYEGGSDLHEVLLERTAQQWLDLKSVQERIERIDAEIYKQTGKRLFGYQKTGAQWLTLRHGALLADDPGTGKLQPVSEPVLTPRGWVSIGCLKVGDEVIGRNGLPTTVTGVFPQGEQDIYSVRTTDGAETRCGLEHLWLVYNPNDRKRGSPGRVLTLREILDVGLEWGEWGKRWFVPMPEPVVFEQLSAGLPIHPYLLGALIANGCFVANMVTHSGTEEQRHQLRPLLAEMGLELRKHDEVTYRLAMTVRRPENPIVRALKMMGLNKKRSREKFVPAPYLFGTIEERRALLAGLLDGDGTVDSRTGTTVEYNTTSPQLAEDVRHLVRSLGGTARMSTRVPTFIYLGEKKRGRMDHRVRVTLDFNPFLTFSKKERWQPRTKYPPARAIESVERVGREQTVCIRVAADDHLYVTKDFIVTHNTLQVLVSLPANAPVLVVGPAAAKGVWVGEVENWRSQLPVRMLSGRDSFRWPKPGNMLVTNYDILPDVHADGCTGFLPLPPPKPCPGCLEELVFHNGKTMTVTKHGAHEAGCSGTLPQPEPTPCPGCHPMLKEVPIGMVLVADEAHALKNGQALRTKRFRALSRAVREKEGRCWLVTGTPMENEPSELWSTLDAAGLAQEAFGSYKNFVALFKGKPRMFGAQRAGYDWGTPDGDVAERLQRVSLRRRAEDVLPELPDLLWREVVVDVDLAAIGECDAFVERSGGIGEIARLLSQEKIPFDKMSRILTVLAVAKYKAALEIVKEHEKRGEPLLVFSMHREPIDLLAKRKGWLTITGDTPPEKRFAIAESFQDPKQGYKGVACMIQAAGVALTMHRAAHELFIDRSWNPKLNEQAAKRAHRIGQRKSVVATVLRANHLLDKHLQNMLAKKSRLFVDSVDAAAVLDDAPPCLDQDFEAIVRRTQEEISLGRAVRRMADTDEQKATVERIHRVIFVRASDERMARQLGEEALAIGLSEAQWDLAARVAARGREPEEHAQALDEEKAKEAKKAKEEQKPIGKKKEVAKAIEPATRLPHHEEIDMEKIEQAFGEIAALSDDERDVLFDLIGAEDPVDVAKIETIAKRVLALNEKSRDALLGKLHEAGFMGDLDDDDDDDDGDDDEEDEDDNEGEPDDE